MVREGTVTMTDPGSGRFGLLVRDGGYVLAEQLDARPLAVGAELSGAMETIGVETFSDTRTGTDYSVFILAYDLSLETVEQEFR